MAVPTRVARAPFSGRRVLLGVTGGIAAFKAIALARELALAGSVVDVVLSTGGLEFVKPLSFEALTGRPCFGDLYTPGDPLLHIRLAREADLVVVAPATANFIARAAAGMADDLLTATLLATRAPVLICPAMNDRMYAHPATRRNVRTLEEIGYHRAGPDQGTLAWGEGEGEGRMLEPPAILDHASRLLFGSTPLTEKRVLVTAGPTREPIDPVRFVGNRSSGRMGFALAESAWMWGADVVLVSGPSVLPTPTGVRRIDVETAEQMLTAVSSELPEADVLVMAAAVADFRPAAPTENKIKKNADDVPLLELEATADVLQSTMSLRREGAVVVGFALETEAAIENGRRKLEGKKLDLLVVNDATEPGAGFDVETNRVTLLDRTGVAEDLPLLSKRNVAERILGRVAQLMEGDDDGRPR
jgi:phosphopantothenoylcysteine decarboxylase / phosphopantothenate---cysteine ligase